MPDARADTELLLDAVRQAGEIACARIGTPLDIQEKGTLGPVTDVDIEIDEVLRRQLRQARPDYGWLSEETEDDKARLKTGRVFILDPIDGTRSFIAGEPGWAVSLAIIDHGRPVAAAVNLPAREELYSATLGEGAFRGGERIAASDRQEVDGATVLTARKQMLPEHWPGGPPPLDRHFRSSLAWRICLVASGRFDSMLTFRPAWEWDIAAGALIAAEAGAVVTDGSGDELHFNSPEAKQPGLVVAPQILHDNIMAYRLPNGSEAIDGPGPDDHE